MNTYRYQFAALCPNNDEQIVYSLELVTESTVMVESIKEECSKLKTGYQEMMASRLHAQFGGTLTLRASHHGVEIETVLSR